MSARKAQREVFTLLHHGLSILANAAPGGPGARDPLDGGVELHALVQSLRGLPLLCLSTTNYDAGTIHKLSANAVREVVSWVAPRVPVATAPTNTATLSREAAGGADRALLLLEATLQILEMEIQSWVDGEYKEEPLNPAMIALIFSKTPYQVQSFQENGTSCDPLLELVRKIPSQSTLARVLEASGILEGTMLSLLLKHNLEVAARWVGRKELMHPDPKVLLAQKVQLVQSWPVIFPDTPITSRELSWFGSSIPETLHSARLLASLSPNETETAERLAGEFNGTLGELLECARGLS